MGNTEVETGQPLLEKQRSPDKNWAFMKYLVTQEFLERFALKSVQTVLALFLLEKLHFNEVVATEIVHFFLIGALISPLLGSILSDGFLGNYHSNILFAICELIGHVFLTITAFPNVRWHESGISRALIPVALGLMATGSGAMKPCQVAFGGEQMQEALSSSREGGPAKLSNLRTSQNFFSAYYMAMNLGSCVATVVSPIIRSVSSYFFAFLSPTLGMFSCLYVFWLGRKVYNYKPLPKHWGVANKITSQQQEHWEDTDVAKEDSERLVVTAVENPYSSDGQSSYMKDLKATLYLLFLLSPTPFFSALFFQTNSTWVFQARSMDGHVPWLGGLVIQPDQMPALNPILVAGVIPLMDNVIYPLMPKLLGPHRNLRRIVVGMGVAALAFFVSGLLQIVVDARLEENAGLSNHADISVLWQVPQYFLISLAETLIFIPAIDFCYAEAVPSMKTTVQAVLHAYSGVGNIITILVVAILGSRVSKATESFVFAGLGAFGATLLAALSSKHVYIADRER